MDILKKAKENNKWGLYIYGDTGVGKTYLAKQIKQKYKIPMYTFLDIINDIQDAMKDRYEYQRLGYYQRLPRLIIDDLGAEKYSEYREELLYQIINYRTEHKLYTIITSNLTTRELAEKYGKRLASRILEMCLIVKKEGKDKRLEKRVEITI